MSSLLSKQKEHLHRCSFYLRENPFLPNQQKKPSRAAFPFRAGNGRSIGFASLAFLPKEKNRSLTGFSLLEQATGIEPATSAWEADVLPLNYACDATIIYHFSSLVKRFLSTKSVVLCCRAARRGPTQRWSGITPAAQWRRGGREWRAAFARRTSADGRRCRYR